MIKVRYVSNDVDNTVSRRLKSSRKSEDKIILSSITGPQFASKALVPENINAFRGKFKKPRDNSFLWVKIRERNTALFS